MFQSVISFQFFAIAAAKNCLHVFEDKYPGDDRPRKALEAAEKWFKDPTAESRRVLYDLETKVWRSGGWSDSRADFASQACGFAARAARKPMTSAMGVIQSEAEANGINLADDYSRQWLWNALYRIRPPLV